MAKVATGAKMAAPPFEVGAQVGHVQVVVVVSAAAKCMIV